MPKIYEVSRADFIKISEEVFARFLEHSEISKNERRGAYIGLYDMKEQKKILIVELGHCPPEKSDRYFNFAIEKLDRLLEKQKEGHVSSYQSRDEKLWQYGGAIIAPRDSKGNETGKNLIGSLAGMHDHSEEAVIIVIFLAFGWLTLEDAGKIAHISKNDKFLPFCEACRDIIER